VSSSVDAEPRLGRPCGPSLDLHEGISDPAALGCPRWPENLRLLNRSTGELVRGRCRATNQCSYCAKLAAVENAELLALDALAGGAPSIWLVLTTATASDDPRRFYRSREQVWKAVKRRWPNAEYAGLVEFTTGYGTRSEGRRRPHWNLLVRGVDPADLEQLRDVVTSVWCRREHATPEAQFAGHVDEVGGLLRYIALHFQKQSQQPPKGWRGHRFLHSRGYLSRPTPELRHDAQRSLRLKRLIWRGLDVETAELELALAESTTWTMQHVRPGMVLDLAAR
jgi:hypothetical protein